MEDHKSLHSLDNQGAVLAVYADKFSIYFVYEDHEDNILYVITTDKLLIIQSVQEVRVPNEIELDQVKWLKWYKPTQVVNDGLRFNGMLEQSGRWYKFTIDASGNMTVAETSNVSEVEQGHPALTNIKVDVLIARQQKLFVAGVDTRYAEQVFCVLELSTGRCLKRYHLTSDLGDITIRGITIDPDEQKVILVGEMAHFDNNDVYRYSRPYVEFFSLQ